MISDIIKLYESTLPPMKRLNFRFTLSAKGVRELCVIKDNSRPHNYINLNEVWMKNQWLK